MNPLPAADDRAGDAQFPSSTAGRQVMPPLHAAEDRAGDVQSPPSAAGRAGDAPPPSAAGRPRPLCDLLPALVPALLASLVLGAHFLRTGRPALVALGPAALGLLLFRRHRALRAVQALLLACAGYWLVLLAGFTSQRQEMGLGWGRLAGIFVAVSLGTAAGAWALDSRRSARRLDCRLARGSAVAPLAAFLLTAVLLGVVQILVPRPMLLPARFADGAGWWAVLGLAAWAGWLTERLADPAAHPRWRARAWGIFRSCFSRSSPLGSPGSSVFSCPVCCTCPCPPWSLGGRCFEAKGSS